MSTIKERIKSERNRLGLSQVEFASLGEVGKHSQINYESGKRHPDTKYLSLIQNHGVDVVYILTGVRNENGSIFDTTQMSETLLLKIQGQDFERIPRYDVFLAAGNGLLNDDTEPVEHLAFSRAWLRKMNIQIGMGALLSVKGDSMEPTLRDGDLVLVDRQQTVIKNNAVYALSDLDGSTRVKRIELIPGQAIILRSDNPTFDTEVRKKSDMNRLQIVGQVVWSGRAWK